MSIGISTSCMYPLETEKSLELVAGSGVDVTEIFFNSPSELKRPMLEKLRRITESAGVRVSSVHPFLSFAEGYLFFSEYERRFEDSLELYKSFFEAAGYLGADILVIHGCKTYAKFPREEYYRRFGKLAELGESFGVRVSQENVVNYYSMYPDFLYGMKEALGSRFHMTLDVKQALRSGCNAFELIEELHDNIVNVHISDSNSEKDCMIPLKGNFDFKRLFDTLRGYGFGGDYIVELYRDNFDDFSDVAASAARLKELMKQKSCT